MNIVEQWHILVTLSAKEIKRFLRIWIQTLVPPMISIMLYFLIFGAFIGSRIGEMGGRRYMEFIVPGLIMMSSITSAYANVSSSFYGNKFQRSLECMLIAPIPNYLLLAGFVIGGTVRSLLTAILVMLVATRFVEIEFYSFLIAGSVILLTAIIFSLGGFINGMLADKFDDIAIIPTFVLTPLTYLGGVFYDIELLPDLWRNISYFNPVVYVVSGFRYGLFGDSGSVGIAYVFLMLIVFLVALWSLCIWLLHRGTGIKS